VAAQILVEYTVEPHVIMDLEASSYHVGGKHVWQTSSSLVQAWLARRNAQYRETHAFASTSDINGGVGALLVQAYAGRPKVFISVLHVCFTDKVGKQSYHSYMYTFQAAPPFRILGIGEKELPLVRKDCRWGAAVVFPMSLVLSDSPSGAELQLLYGSGDSEAHRLIMPLSEPGSFLPARHDVVPGQHGLTLVMMSHSRGRFQDLKEILRHYRAMSPGLLEEIILVWNNPQDPGAMEELRLMNNEEGVPMQVIAADVNSMNNRFAVWETVSTDGVIIQDDDMWVDEADLSCLVDIWRAEPGRLVGASNERTHIKRDATGHLSEMSPRCEQDVYLDHNGNRVYGNDTYCKFWGEEYSMLLPHPWVLSRRYLQLYTESHEATALVDSMHNCDDIYLNAVVSNYTRAPPVAVHVRVHRYPTWMDGGAMWVSDHKWKEHRGQCLEKVNSYYVGEPMSPDTGTVFRLASHSLTCQTEAAHTNRAISSALQTHSWAFPTAGGVPWDAEVDFVLAHKSLVVMLTMLLLFAWSRWHSGSMRIIVCWTAASVSMNLVNKQASNAFPATCLLVIFQMIIADAVLCSSLDYTSLRLAAVRRKDLAKWMVVPLLFAGMLCTSLMALKCTTLSTFLIFRNTLPIITFVAEKALYGVPKEASTPLLLSLALTLGGIVLYGWKNASLSHCGAALTVLNCALTCVDKLVQRTLLTDPDFTVSVPLCMLINNTAGILPMLFMAICTGEVWRWQPVVAAVTPSSCMLLAVSGLLGCCLGITGLWMQQAVTATMALVLQNVSKIIVISIGIFVFKDAVVGLGLAGCVLALAGSAWYSYLQLPRELKEKGATEDPLC